MGISFINRLKRIGRMRSIPKFMFKVFKVQRKMKRKISIYSDTNYFNIEKADSSRED